MGRIRAPAWKLDPCKPKRERKRQEFKYKVGKPLPGQLEFREFQDNAQATSTRKILME